jgi:hypothetical protein
VEITAAELNRIAGGRGVASVRSDSSMSLSLARSRAASCDSARLIEADESIARVAPRARIERLLAGTDEHARRALETGVETISRDGNAPRSR